MDHPASLFEAAKSLNGQLPDWALWAAADELSPVGPIQRSHAVACIERAGAILRRFEEGAEATPIRMDAHSPTMDFLRAEYLRLVEPAVRRTREELFGAPEAPFPSDYASALEWLSTERAHDEPGRETTAEEDERFDELLQVIDEATVEAELIRGRPLEPIQCPTVQTATYLDASERPRGFGSREGSKLHRLAQVTIGVSRTSGFQEVDVVRLILCGDIPPLPRALGRVHRVSRGIGGSRIDRAEVHLTIHAPDLSIDDLKELRTFIRQAWQSSDGGPPLKFRDDEATLQRILVELGDDPTRRRPRGFWSEVLERWRDATGDESSTVALLKMREQRMRRKRQVTLPPKERPPHGKA